MRLGKKIRNIAAAFLMVVSTVTPYGGALLRNAYAASGDEPRVTKTISENKDSGGKPDGTYTITLSVTGKASSTNADEGANVVVVLDTSGSMSYYLESDTGRYGSNDTERPASANNSTYHTNVTLYSTRTYNERTRRYECSGEITNNTTSGTVYRNDGNEGCRVYSGQRYDSSKTRLDSAKSSLSSLFATLLANNTPGHESLVEISFISFSTNATLRNSWTTSGTALNNTLNNSQTIYADGGTNWDDALRLAKSTLDAKNDGDDGYVIFMSDGNPTFYHNCQNQYNNQCSGNDKNETTVTTSYNQAAPQALAITNAGYNLYNLGVYGSVDRMSNLTTYANTATNTGHGDAYYYAAQNETAVNAAFAQIANAITNNLSLTGISFSDGITSMTSVAIEGSASGFTYTKGGSAWTNAPAASFANGVVTWDLGNTVLADGETATVSFTVYPSQEALDLVADLNNGAVQYDTLTDAQKAQFSDNGDGTYSLKTNVDEPKPKMTYRTVTTTIVNGESTTTYSDPKTVEIENPDPVGLYSEEIELQKLWEDSLDPSQRLDDNEVQDIYLQFFIDGEEYTELPRYTENGILVEKQEGTTWGSGKISIAPGLMVSEGHAAFNENAHNGVVTMNGKRYAILNKGHEYMFGEKDINNHFELTNYIYHPMKVDGVLMNVTFTTDDAGNITGVESVKPMSTISATNTIKGGINIQKKVVDENNNPVDVNDKFKTVVHLINKDGIDTPYRYDYRIYYGKNNPEYGKEHNCGTNSQGNPIIETTRSCHNYGTGDITEYIYVGDELRVVNVEAGTKYYVEEPEQPKSYELDSITTQIAEGSVEESAYGAYKESQTETIDGEKYFVMQGNSAWRSIITNKYAFGHLKVSKTVDGATTKYPRSFDFTLKLSYEEDGETKELTDWAYDYTLGETTGTLHYGETFSLADGDEITFANLPEGVTYEVTETAAAGYTTKKTGDTGTIVKNETAEAEFTNTYSLSGHVKIEAKKQFNNWPYGDTFTFNLTGEGKNLTDTIENANDSAVFEFDVNEEKTYVYTISETGTLRDGVTKTSGDITVVVTAVEQKDDNGYGTGVLAIDTQYTSAGGNVITNTYEAKGTVQFSATKLLTGRDWANQESFAFTLYGSDATYSLGDVIGSKTATETSAAVFDEIEYSFGNNQADKTFYYVIRETTSLDGTGMTNNTGDLHVKVDVTDKHDGTLETKVTYENGQVIENVYSAEGKATLKATKTLSGRSWNEGETYTFELKDETGATIATKTVSANGEITFTDDDFVSADKVLNFDQDDVLDGPITKKYTITETGNMSANGLTPSADIQVEVTVSDAGNGVLKVETNYVDGNTITNTYAASGSVTLEATKKFAGADRDWTENYTFNLSGNGQNQDKVATKAKPTVTFDPISYTLDDAGKTYTYTIAETGMNLAGVTASGAITVDVTVTDDGHGNLTATPVYANGVKEITNTYYTEPVDVTLHVDKLIVDDSGESGVDGTFEFTLSGNGVSETQTVTTENLKGGVDFTTMQFTKAGTYTYTLKEVDSGEDGFTYDTTEYTVTITVKDTAEAKLVAQVTYGESDKLEITNHYATSTAITFTATKKLNGWDENNGYDAPIFYFALYEVAEDGTETQVGENKSVSGSGTVNFDAISYTKTGTYNYVVKEVSGNAGGISYDDAEYKIVVVVTGENGALKATPTITKDGESASSITFENNYLAKGTITLQAEKVLNGRDWLEGEKHTFVLKSGNTVLQTKDVTSKGVISFDEIEYTKAGTYTYTVEEELSDDYDGSLTHTGAVTVTVNVKDNGDGTLTASCSTEDVPTITNTYTSEGSVDVDVTKVVTGREWLAGETFTFALYKDGEKVAEKTVTKDEPTATFTMNYTQKDTDGAADENGEVKLEYTIKEISEMPANMEQPDDLSVVVTLKDDNHGNIEATVDQPDGYTITNEYVPTPTSAQFHVEKEIDDRSDSGANGEFTFVLKDENGEEIESKTINTENESGADFAAITYTKAGTYKYTITEQGGSAAGYSYDEVAHNVVVTVTDDNAGTLTATVTYDGNESLTITNVYEAEPVDVTIDVEKSIYGIDNVDSDKLPTFEFELTGDGVEDTMKVTITGEGKASFGAVTFTKVGTYTLKVHEVEGNAGGYIYDDNDVTVTVVVTDNGGQLVAEVSYSKGLAEGLETAIFTNGYEAAPIEDYEIIVQKMLEGRDLVEGEFQFVLIDTNGEEIATGTNDANGNVVFSGISFDEVGTYNFLVKEVADPERGEIDFDTNEYEVTIVVKDNGEGQLVVESDTSSEVIFKNKYNEPGKGENPRTDDDILSVVAMMVISTIGLIGAVLFGKRAKQEDKVEA